MNCSCIGLVVLVNMRVEMGPPTNGLLVPQKDSRRYFRIQILAAMATDYSSSPVAWDSKEEFSIMGDSVSETDFLFNTFAACIKEAGFKSKTALEKQRKVGIAKELSDIVVYFQATQYSAKTVKDALPSPSFSLKSTGSSPHSSPVVHPSPVNTNSRPEVFSFEETKFDKTVKVSSSLCCNVFMHA